MRFKGLLALVLVLCAGAVPASAQQTGAISGKVVDTSNAVLPGVTVEARSDVLPSPRVTVTEGNGEYRLPALPPGKYTLTFTLSGMQTVTAASGAEAIGIMERTPDISLALMDIMMPEMDGYETMRRIRKNRQFSMLPIIALTAKAMKGDREKCLEAGASDYIAKPVNSEQLLSLLRTWLHR